MCGWLIAIVFTITVYNQVGIAAGYEGDMYFPESKYDNNNISVIIVAGWFYPLLALLGMWVVSIIKVLVNNDTTNA